MSAAFSCSHLSGGYGKVPVVHDVSLHLRTGQRLALVGRNGMGKSTFLKVVLGLAQRHQGAVEVLGEDVSRWPPHRIVRMGVAYVPQEAALFQDLTVDENLLFAALRVKEYVARRDDILTAFPRLQTRLRLPAGTLSGGERKMLLLARALLPRPRLMLLDEVTEGMQPSLLQLTLEALSAIAEDTGTAILLVEQNVPFAFSLGERFAVIKRGGIVDEGATSESDAVPRVEQHMVL